MQNLSLKKILERSGAIDLLRSLTAECSFPVTIDDSEGRCLVPDLRDPGSSVCSDRSEYSEIIAEGRSIGRVFSFEKKEAVSQLISYLAKVEQERRMLASETLDKYREISFLCDFTEKIADCLDVEAVSDMVLKEAMRHITADGASVLLFHEEKKLLEPVTVMGTASSQFDSTVPGEGIIGEIFESGKAEIINDISLDSRHVSARADICSMICAPVCIKEKKLGIITLCRHSSRHFASHDLKLLTVLTAQAASAIENVQLHQNRLRQMEIRNRLGRYLSPRVVDSLIHNESNFPFAARKRKVTMLFSDIRSFSAKCEELLAEEIVSYLNSYFSSLVSVIFAQQGTVNKFVGDMIVAMFGAPEELENQELCAIHAAVEMQKCIAGHPDEWIRRNFLTGIGISSGESVVGNIGSPEHLDYTAIGDEVNIASRLQSLASGGQILVTRTVRDAVSDDSNLPFTFREFGTIQVKGKKNVVEVYEVLYS